MAYKGNRQKDQEHMVRLEIVGDTDSGRLLKDIETCDEKLCGCEID